MSQFMWDSSTRPFRAQVVTNHTSLLHVYLQLLHTLLTAPTRAAGMTCHAAIPHQALGFTCALNQEPHYDERALLLAGSLSDEESSAERSDPVSGQMFGLCGSCGAHFIRLVCALRCLLALLAQAACIVFFFDKFQKHLSSVLNHGPCSYVFENST